MDFFSARTKCEALEFLQSRGAETGVVAGGTDVMVQLAARQISPAALLHIERLKELAGIRDSGTVRIGSLVTQRELAENDLIARKFPDLAKAASLCGGWQTQSVGTIGGNICNASPAADLIPVLLAHDAVLVLESKARGERKIPLCKFVLGRRRIAREPDELLTGIELSSPPRHSGSAFIKVGRRSAMEIAIVNLAVRMTLEGDRRIAAIAVAAGSVAPSAFRASAVEEMLLGMRIDELPVEQAAQCLLGRSAPIDDVRASQTYRMTVLPRVFRQCLEEAAKGAAASLEDQYAD